MGQDNKEKLNTMKLESVVLKSPMSDTEKIDILTSWGLESKRELEKFKKIHEKLKNLHIEMFGPINYKYPNDTLSTLFELQKVFQRRVYKLKKIPDNLPKLLPMQVTSLIAEIGEILELNQKWKSWKKNPADYDRDEMLFEVVDAFHFLINIALFLDFDADEVFDAFLKKNKINHERQNKNY